MTTTTSTLRVARMLLAPLAATLMLAAGLAVGADTKVTLSGAEVVPAVQTTATGTGTITVHDDKTVTGSVSFTNLAPFAAHIHQGESGKNGPPIIFLEKTGDNVWSVVPGAKLSDEQYAAYKAGNLYAQFHTEQHRPGEIRGQLRP